MVKRNQKSNDKPFMDYGLIDYCISTLSQEDQGKMEFIEDFIHSYLAPGAEDNDIITIEPLEYKLLKYLLFSLLMKYESVSGAS